MASSNTVYFEVPQVAGQVNNLLELKQFEFLDTTTASHHTAMVGFLNSRSEVELEGELDLPHIAGPSNLA